MSMIYIDFRLTQGHGDTQLLALAEDSTYPSYQITIYYNSGRLLPSLVTFTPDVSISHRSYLASSFAEATFHKYRNGLSIIYPETAIRTPDGDVTTTVEDLLPLDKQNIKCENLGDKQYSLELDLGGGRREVCGWHPPRKDLDRIHWLELRRIDGDTDGEEALAKILRKDWNDVSEGQLIATVRVREGLMNDQEQGRRGTVDQIMVTAVALIERWRRRHRYFASNRACW